MPSCVRCVLPMAVRPPVPLSSAAVAAAETAFVQFRFSSIAHAVPDAISLKSPTRNAMDAPASAAIDSAAAATAAAWYARVATSVSLPPYWRWQHATTTGAAPPRPSVAVNAVRPSSNSSSLIFSIGSFDKMASPSRRGDPSRGWNPRRREEIKRCVGSLSRNIFFQRSSKNHSWRQITCVRYAFGFTSVALERRRHPQVKQTLQKSARTCFV